MSWLGPWPPWVSPWTPLMQAAIAASSEVEYRRGIKFFLEWLNEEGKPAIYTAKQMDYALCEYGWYVFENMAGRGRSRLHNAIYGIEHFLPAFKGRMTCARRSEVGWAHLKHRHI